MTSPWLAHHHSGQRVIYKLHSMYRNSVEKMIHSHLLLILGIFFFSIIQGSAESGLLIYGTATDNT